MRNIFQENLTCVLEIINIVLEKHNKYIMKRKDYIKALLMISISISVIAGMVVSLLSTDKSISSREWGMIAALVLVVGFALFLAFRRLRAVKEDLPAEDEMSKKILRSGAATSYYLSLYFWLALMFFEDRIQMDTHSLIGLGIMGMAVIFALSWIYHRFISRSYD